MDSTIKSCPVIFIRCLAEWSKWTAVDTKFKFRRIGVIEIITKHFGHGLGNCWRYSTVPAGIFEGKAVSGQWSPIGVNVFVYRFQDEPFCSGIFIPTLYKSVKTCNSSYGISVNCFRKIELCFSAFLQFPSSDQEAKTFVLYKHALRLA